MKIQSSRIICVRSNFDGAQTFTVPGVDAPTFDVRDLQEFLNDIFSIILFQFWIQLNLLSKFYVASKM